MTSELPRDFFDDFYAECDDLFDTIWSSIDRLERTAQRAQKDGEALHVLFRSLHTLKGNAGIVALRAVEQLAHAAEELLRALGRRPEPPTTADIEKLRDSVRTLQQMIEAHQAGQALPDGQRLVEALAVSTAATTADASTVGPAVPAAGPGERPPGPSDAEPTVWRCTFRPSIERDSRGVNIASVRERLGALGDILEAMPSVHTDGSIEFTFSISLRTLPTDLERWEADGIRWEQPVISRRAGQRPVMAAPVPMLPHSPVVRVDLAELDELMRITAELVIHRSRLEDRLGPMLDDGNLREVVLALSRSLRELRGAVSRVRLVPAAEIFNRIPLVVRDLTLEWEHPVGVHLEGQQTQIDKHVVERLKEPLLHLVRNALAHGIEAGTERRAAGKPPEGQVSLRAVGEGNFVEIEVRDDGRGIDPERVAARARAIGLAVPEPLDDAGLLKLLCHAGFSTRESADRAAGRGIGMAVVANAVRELGGSLALATQPGRGSVFTLRIPLMLSILEVILVAVDAHLCAVPQNAVEQILQVPRADARWMTPLVLPYRDELIPMAFLRTWFKLEALASELLTVVVLRTEQGRVGLIVDRAVSQREVVLQPLRDPLVQVLGFSGATELGDGRPVLVVDPAAMTTATLSASPVIAQT